MTGAVVGASLLDPERSSPARAAGLGLATAVLGPLMTGVVTLPVGALAGWLLYVLR